MDNTQNIILVGFMGTGKTTVGKILAERLQRPLMDMDKEIERKEGRLISEIFDREGETYFRKLERELVIRLCAKKNLIIACGGGVVLNPQNIEDYQKTGLVVCLQGDPEILLKRLKGDHSRPLLAFDDKDSRLHNILSARKKFYDQIPFQINTSNIPPEEVAEKILLAFSS